MALEIEMLNGRTQLRHTRSQMRSCRNELCRCTVVRVQKQSIYNSKRATKILHLWNDPTQEVISCGEIHVRGLGVGERREWGVLIEWLYIQMWKRNRRAKLKSPAEMGAFNEEYISQCICWWHTNSGNGYFKRSAFEALKKNIEMHWC